MGKPLTVTLNIAEDAELRGVIKDMIRGQVISVVRDELKVLVKEITTAEIEKVVAAQLKPIVQSEIATLNSRFNSPNKLETLIRDAVKENAKGLADVELEQRVYQKALAVMKRDDAEQEAFTQRLVDKSVRNFFGKLAPTS